MPNENQLSTKEKIAAGVGTLIGVVGLVRMGLGLRRSRDSDGARMMVDVCLAVFGLGSAVLTLSDSMEQELTVSRLHK